MPIATPAGYRALAEPDVADYLAGLPAIAARLGGAPERWRVREVGDGNLNLVFIVEGPGGAVCVKQALPYVRVAGEGWPMPLERAFFEHRATIAQAPRVPGLVPEMLHYDEGLFLMVMERLHPHIIMRKGMIAATVYPRFAEQIAEYMAQTLFGSSDLAVPAAAKKAEVALFCANTELCRITEDLIFTDPYMVHPRNRWTSPQLDDAAAAIRADAPLKRAVSLLKLKFLTEAQALLHGDLHTGSIMVTERDTRVIDPEFAFYGPMGFDVGKLLGNLLMSFFSQDGHEGRPGERDAYRDWVLATVEEVRCLALRGVPTMFIAELSHPDFPSYSMETLRTGIMAGSPCPIEVMKEVNRKMNMSEIVIVYGQTETSPGITMTTTRDPLERRVSTVGKVFPHTELKIVDPKTGKIVPRGEVGEICARGYCVMKCYYNNP
ncbi:MAG: S-methyl-5-thioribose kinase, partial [Methanolinea sp.]